MAKPQKPEQLRELKTEELEQKLAVLAEERFRLAFRRGTEAIANPLQFRAMRRRSEEHTSELQSRLHLVCRLLLEKKKNKTSNTERYGHEIREDTDTIAHNCDP